MLLNRMILCSKLKNGLFKIVTKSQVATKFTVTVVLLGQKSIYLYFNPRNHTFFGENKKEPSFSQTNPKKS